MVIIIITGLVAILIVAFMLDASGEKRQFLRKLCREDLPRSSLVKSSRDLSGELFSCPGEKTGEKEKCFHMDVSPGSGGQAWAFRYLVQCGKSYYVVDGSSMYEVKVFGPFQSNKDLEKFEQEAE